MRFEGKVALVTGGAGSMGSEEVRIFAAEGARVVIVDRVPDHGHALAQELNDGGTSALYVNADIASPSGWDAITRSAMEAFGRVDVLVNNAGISSNIVEDPYDLDAWDQIIGVNMKAPFLAVQHLIPIMQAQHAGSIVNVSSIAALVGLPAGHLAYSCSKGGLAAFSRTVAVRYGSDGIRSNTVYPGTMPPMRSGRSSDQILTNRMNIATKTAVGRIGVASEVAQGVVFLSSDDASYITGADLTIDGGFVCQ